MNALESLGIGARSPPSDKYERVLQVTYGYNPLSENSSQNTEMTCVHDAALGPTFEINSS